MLWTMAVYGGADTLLLRCECSQPDAAFAVEQAAALVRVAFGSHAHIQKIIVSTVADGPHPIG